MKIGLRFIKSSISFIKYENLWGILNLIENEPSSKDKTKITNIVNDEIQKRDKKLLKRVALKDGKEVWVKTKK